MTSIVASRWIFELSSSKGGGGVCFTSCREHPIDFGNERVTEDEWGGNGDAEPT